MSDVRWQFPEELFRRALDVPDHWKRCEVLDSACAGAAHRRMPAARAPSPPSGAVLRAALGASGFFAGAQFSPGTVSQAKTACDGATDDGCSTGGSRNRPGALARHPADPRVIGSPRLADSLPENSGKLIRRGSLGPP